MTLLERLKRLSAGAADALKDVAAAYGSEAVVSVVISHPGTTEDAFIVGEHEISDIYAILKRLETGGRVECDVTSSGSTPDEPIIVGPGVQ